MAAISLCRFLPTKWPGADGWVFAALCGFCVALTSPLPNGVVLFVGLGCGWLHAFLLRRGRVDGWRWLSAVGLAFCGAHLLGVWGLERLRAGQPVAADLDQTYRIAARVRTCWQTDYGTAIRVEAIRMQSPAVIGFRLERLTLYAPELATPIPPGSHLVAWIRLQSRPTTAPVPWPLRRLRQQLQPALFGTVKDLRLMRVVEIRRATNSPLNQGNRELMGLFLRGEPSRLWRERFAPFGVGHLLAISGLHVGLVFLLLQGLCWPIQRPWPRLIFIVTGMVSFASWVGWSASVMRACSSLLLWLLLTAMCRPRSTLRLWSILVLIALAVAPEMMVARGFWTSFAASLGLICAYRHQTETPLQHPLLPKMRFGLSILAAQIFVLPVNFMFDGFSAPTDLLWNLMGMVFLVLLLSLLVACVVATAVPVLAPVVNGTEQLFASGLGWLAGFSPEWGVVRLPWSPLLALMCLAAFYVSLRFGGREWRWYGLMLCLTVGLMVNRPVRGERLLMVDVGQGQCMVYVTSQGDGYLYDVGGRLPSGLPLRRLLAMVGVRTVAAVVVSHHDWDHYGLMADLDIDGPVYVPAPQRAAFAASAIFDGAELVGLARGDRLQFGNLAVHVLWPRSDHVVPNDNEGSLVMIWTHRTDAQASWSLLLTGDAGRYVEDRLAGEDLQTGMVLQVGHHGSRSATGKTWVAWLQPAQALISRGRNNRFNHPHPQVMDALQAQGTPIFDSGEQGTVVVAEAGRLVLRTTRPP